MKAYEAFSSWVRSAISGPFDSEGRLRREPMTERDQRVAGSEAERGTVASPCLFG
jgi:hypothetical protein